MATAPALSDDLPLPHGCTFAPHDWRILARHWYPVAIAREVADVPLRAKLLDQPLVIYRFEGEVVIAPDVCPHRGVPLSMGRLGPRGVVCPYHGLTFGAGAPVCMCPPSRSAPSLRSFT
jgi:vanillate O-demethylase monooxygenase subunit